jgi:catechol 2,3-dioxygenase-like lactoylglutathione lyase family enzyme
MNNPLAFKTANTILYCQKWQETVAFYRDTLQLPITFASDWFVEFEIGGNARLSVANEQRSKVKTSQGAGITLAWQVENADETWLELQTRVLELEAVRNHAWGARVFYFYDPEGHRLEIWSSKPEKEEPAGKGGYLPV